MKIITPEKKIIYSPNSRIAILGWVCAVLCDAKTGKVIKVFKTRNLITGGYSGAGDQYYARKSISESPVYEFTSGGLKLGSATPTPSKSDTDVQTYLSSTYKAKESGYPKTNDDDTDNAYYGNDDYATWKFFYGTSEANYSNINEGAIVDQESSPNAALTHFVFSSTIVKTAANTLKVFVNHEFLGA